MNIDTESKKALKIWMFFLFFNVIAIGIVIYQTDHNLWDWVNLIGCVVFGWVAKEFKDKK